ncbi:MAG TPA: response regulator [Candidatus Nitrosotenuis sp.]|nr:response regulator [Candidatus Nitrosotenuis sp.]
MKRLLIVEDEAALRDVYAILFKMQNYDVHEAVNGKEAIKLMETLRPDVIILDALMPVMGGIEFLETIKIKENYPDTRVLFLTNLSDQKTVTQSKKMGAHKYLLKASVSPKELITAVGELVDSE